MRRGADYGRLASGLGVTPRRVTALVQALEADGFVERHPHPTDGRSTLGAITDGGLKVQQAGVLAAIGVQPSGRPPVPARGGLSPQDAHR